MASVCLITLSWLSSRDSLIQHCLRCMSTTHETVSLCEDLAKFLKCCSLFSTFSSEEAIPPVVIVMHLLHLFSFLPLAGAVLQTRQDLSDYNTCAQVCISSLIGGTGCITTTSTAYEQNICLCNDATYLSAVAKCTYTSCGASILDNTAMVSVSNCAGTDTPSILSVQDMINAGLPGQ